MFDFYEIGMGLIYRVVGYELVLNYYFDEVILDILFMIFDIYKGKNVRFGLLLLLIFVGYIIYNDKNIYWIIVYDIVNIVIGFGVFFYVNYLNN